MRMRRRSALAAGVACVWAVVTATAAGASVTGPCDGSVTIDGVTYGPDNDSTSDPIVVPADASEASWEGTTGTPITDHRGQLEVVLGPGAVEIASWSGENADREVRAEGTHSITATRAELGVDLVGVYVLRGRHEGTGGACTGSVVVRLEGSPLSTPVGQGAAAATLLGLAGVAAAGAGGGASRGTTTTTEVR